MASEQKPMTLKLTPEEYLKMPPGQWPKELHQHVNEVAKKVGLSGDVIADAVTEWCELQKVGQDTMTIEDLLKWLSHEAERQDPQNLGATHAYLHVADHIRDNRPALINGFKKEYFKEPFDVDEYYEDKPDAPEAGISKPSIPETELDRLQALADLVDRVGENSIRKVDKGEWLFTNRDEVYHQQERVRRSDQRLVDALNELKPKFDKYKALADLVPRLVEALVNDLDKLVCHPDVKTDREVLLAEARRLM